MGDVFGARVDWCDLVVVISCCMLLLLVNLRWTLARVLEA